jgi:uncharacterized protein (TIGR03067 family)
MRFWIPALAAVAFFACVTTAADDKKPAAKKKLLVITQSKGFVHDVVKRPEPDKLCLVEQILTEIGEKAGDFEVTCSQDARKEITAENLKNYGAVFFYTTGELELSDVQKADLLEFVRSGKGFAGTHSATDTFYKWPEYGNLIGGYFDGHPWHEKVKVIVEDTKHPATKHLGDSFEITDEIYQFKGPYDRSKLHILMHLDTDSVKKPGKREDKDYAVAWTKEYGKGRVFYTSLGHRPEVWKDERYQKHLLGGLRYVLGLEKADAKPSAPAPKAENKEEDAAAKDLAKLQGTWRLVAEDRDGTVTKLAKGQGHDIVIEKDFEIWYDADGKLALKHKLKLDPSKSPKQMDATCVFSVLFPNDKSTVPSVYEIDGDELKIAYPGELFYPRPKEFTTKKGSLFTVGTYKRVKPKEEK